MNNQCIAQKYAGYNVIDFEFWVIYYRSFTCRRNFFSLEIWPIRFDDTVVLILTLSRTVRPIPIHLRQTLENHSYFMLRLERKCGYIFSTSFYSVLYYITFVTYGNDHSLIFSLLSTMNPRPKYTFQDMTLQALGLFWFKCRMTQSPMQMLVFRARLCPRRVFVCLNCPQKRTVGPTNGQMKFVAFSKVGLSFASQALRTRITLDASTVAVA